jgi:cysteine desulfurase family protein
MIYMDNAATSYPKPVSVIEEAAECMAGWCANPGRAGHDNSMKSAQSVYETRKAASSFIGGKAEANEIIFTANCTDALNLGIKGILEKGDHVITTMMEHNSVLRPLYSLKEKGIESSLLKCDAEGYPQKGSLEKALKPNTKMIICTLSSNVTGTIMPVEEIGEFANKHGIIFMVDGSQGLGSIKFDIAECGAALLASSGHKSLLGPQGTGFLYVSHEIDLKPVREGGTGTRSSELEQPKDMPEGFEAGTLNVPGITGLRAGIKYIENEGIDNIRKKETELISCLQEELKNTEGIITYGPEQAEKRTAIYSFNINNMDCEDAAAALNDRYGIAVRAGYHCSPLAHKAIGTENTGCVRISPGAFSTYEDIIKVAEAIKEIAGGI